MRSGGLSGKLVIRNITADSAGAVRDEERNIGYSTPILILVFNRPKYTERLFEILVKLRPRALFIAADGPRASVSDDVEKIAAVRSVFSHISWPCDVHRLYREKNLGTGLGVAEAINWFFESNARGIILEDDCIPSASFFQFIEAMLIKYESNERVMAIAGTNIVKGVSYDTDYIFTSFPIMWGWASWRRAWRKYDLRMSSWEQTRYIGFRSEFSSSTWKNHPVHHEFFEQTYKKACNGTIDVWDHPWIYSVWINDGLVVTPSVNLVQNVGFGPDATHTFTDHLGRGSVPVGEIHPPYLGPSNHAPDRRTDLYISKHWFSATWAYYLKIRLLKYDMIRRAWGILKNIWMRN